MTKRIQTLICAAVILHGGWTHAAIYAPRILSPHHADVYSLKTFAEFPRWRELSDDEKVLAIFKYLADTRTGIYPMGVPAREGADELTEFGAVTDPVKMLNVYPIGHCGTLGPTMVGIMEGMGIGPARTLILPRWNHVASEVFYGGKWHYLDLDVRAVFSRMDGSLASMADAQSDDSLWVQRERSLFFPLDDLANVRAVYAATPVHHRYGVATGGHTMDFVLRQGETLTRWWRPQQGRWNHHGSYSTRPFPRDLLAREPQGPKCKHPSFTVHTHGNGLFVYRPNLTAASSDFADGLYEARNVHATDSGLGLDGPGAGHATFEVRTPWVIVPLVGEMDQTEDDREASVVKIDASAVTLSVSVNNGLSWRQVELTNGTVDLTSLVSGSYGYLLRVSLAGEGALVRSLEIRTWVQIHPASLPSLRAGRNMMRFVTGDHYGLESRVMEVRPDAAKKEELLRYLTEAPLDYEPSRRTARIRGAVAARLEAPPGTKIAWFSAGASFVAHQGANASQTRNSISYRVDAETSFAEIYRAAVPQDQSHWHYNVDREVRLSNSTRNLTVQYVGDPALNNIRIYAHCVDDRPRAFKPVVISHAWMENGVRKTFRIRLQAPGSYAIDAGADPSDESIEISVPSAGR